MFVVLVIIGNFGLMIGIVLSVDLIIGDIIIY